MGRKNKLTKEQMQDINKLYNEGLNMAQLGQIYKVGHSTINKYVWCPRNRGERAWTL